MTLLTMSACSPDKLVGRADLPSEVIDPAKAQTAVGARSAYLTALVYLREAMGKDGKYVAFSGQLSDELSYTASTTLYVNLDASPDHRQYLETYGGDQSPYFLLQQVRGQSNQAQGLLRDFLPEGNKPLMAHMMAVRGYAELLLADLYCSGIPLSTLDYQGDFTYKPGATTEEVLSHAVALFDSALAIVGSDSVRIQNLARVGKGRALLQLGKFDDAVSAVQDVPVDFRYNLQYSVAAEAEGLISLSLVGSDETEFNAGWISDKEGENGLPFVTERDARLPELRFETRTIGSELFSGFVPVIPSVSFISLASGIEAQLIRAEAALRKNDASWLTLLNQLRTSCTDVTTCPPPAPYGTGGVDSLPLLEVPQNTPMSEKVDLLFRERAYWLFLTGHRIGDLRRLVRLYSRDAEMVFPTGNYIGNVPAYGTDVNLPVPRRERERNSLYSGCIHRGA